jgi:hypothetical protein
MTRLLKAQDLQSSHGGGTEIAIRCARCTTVSGVYASKGTSIEDAIKVAICSSCGSAGKFYH